MNKPLAALAIVGAFVLVVVLIEIPADFLLHPIIGIWDRAITWPLCGAWGWIVGVNLEDVWDALTSPRLPKDAELM